MEDKQTKKFTLDGNTVWLVQTKELSDSEDACSCCVYDWNIPAYESRACPHNEEHGRLECTINENVLMHFTDKDPSAAYSFPSERTSPVITNTALNIQVGGGHYKDMKIQPIEYIHANNLSFLEGNVVKYITRHKTKNKAQDIRKVIHYCELILQLEYNETYEQESK